MTCSLYLVLFLSNKGFKQKKFILTLLTTYCYQQAHAAKFWISAMHHRIQSGLGLNWLSGNIWNSTGHTNNVLHKFPDRATETPYKVAGCHRIGFTFLNLTLMVILHTFCAALLLVWLYGDAGKSWARQARNCSPIKEERKTASSDFYLYHRGEKKKRNMEWKINIKNIKISNYVSEKYLLCVSEGPFIWNVSTYFILTGTRLTGTAGVRFRKEYPDSSPCSSHTAMLVISCQDHFQGCFAPKSDNLYTVLEGHIEIHIKSESTYGACREFRSTLIWK